MDSKISNRMVHTQNENATKRLVSAKLKQGPLIQRPALGDVKNEARTYINAKRILKKNEGSSNLMKIKEEKGNSFLKPVVKTSVPQKEEISKPEASAGDDLEIESLTDAFSTNLLCVEDIDLEDSGNPQLVSQYAQDIYKHLWSLENEHPVKHKYLNGQAITHRMRTVLVDWLIQVHLKFSLIQETLYLTISILDRFLQAEGSITKEKLQLVGVTAMLIASKYEEMYIPELSDFAFITDKAFTERDIRKMEVYILTTLNFYISFPLHLHFLRRNSKAGQVDGKQHTLAKYLMELTLPEYAFCAYKASKVAAASSYLSIKLIGDQKDWTDTLTYYSKYTEKDIMPVVCQICAILIKPTTTSKQQTIRNKYKTSKYLAISEISELRPTSKILRSYASRIVPCSSNTTVKF